MGIGKNTKEAIKNVSYTIASNFISTILSAIVTFIAPKLLGVDDYGYFQLFTFYCTYTGFLHFGLADGVVLRYAGKYYSELNKALFSGQFYILVIFEMLLSSCALVAFYKIFSGPKALVWCFVCFAVVFTIPRYFLQLTLQATNRIKEYALVVVIEKMGYLLALIGAVGLKINYWQAYVGAEIFGRIMAFAYVLYACKEIVCAKPERLMGCVVEIRNNIIPGIKITFAAIASMLIIGTVRISIENQWDIGTFGKVSLTLSVSNLLMLFIRAVALVMFPMLRRTDESKLSGIYSKMRTCLMIPLLGMLVFYYPAKVVLSAWLPQYADSLIYMALLFPMCVFESKMSMLIETYMKTLRKEKWLLIVNLTTVGLSVACTGITVYWLHNLDLAVVSIVVLLAFRCILAETLLSRAIEIDVKKDIACELALTAIFITASWFIGGVAGLAVYLAAYVVYLFIKRKSIVDMAAMVKAKIIHS